MTHRAFLPSKRQALALAAAALAALCSPAALAQDGAYPSKPVRIVVPLTAGGPTDILARIIGQQLSERLGQPVLIENKPGAGSNIGADYVAKSAPDGYTLFMGTSGPLSINASLYGKLPFNPLTDFSPIVLIASAPFVVAVNPSLPAKSVKDFVALAKSKPGQLNFGAVPGSAAHLATELFKSTANLDMAFVPYKGAAPATNDLIAGQIQLSFASTPGVMPSVKAGKLVPLAVTSAKRIAQLPDVPTVAEAGVPGYEASVWYGLVAPAKTPAAIINRLNAEVSKILQDPAMRQKLAANDFEAAGSTPEQFDAYIKSETAKWAKVVKSSGAKPE